jgi:hypothetical protein
MTDHAALLREIPMDQLELSVRTYKVLYLGGYTTLGAVMDATEAQIRSLPNAGSKTWREVAEMQECFAHDRLVATQEVADEYPVTLATLLELANAQAKIAELENALAAASGTIAAMRADVATDQARIAELEAALSKAVQIAERYATVYSEGKPDDWEDRADNMMWGMVRDIEALKPKP